MFTFAVVSFLKRESVKKKKKKADIANANYEVNSVFSDFLNAERLDSDETLTCVVVSFLKKRV